MAIPTRDRFSAQAAEYAAFRPAYPAEMIARLASLAPARDLAWDCATGTGQAAMRLVSQFTHVLATDASAGQLERAARHPRVEYRVSAEDDSGAADRSVDLVTVAQALHWLDLPRFYAEVRRVLKPGGVIAVWCYGPAQVDAEVDEVMRWFEEERIPRFRARELVHVHTHYRDIEFPFDEIDGGSWAIEAGITLEAFLGFVGTWSAVAEARRETGADPIKDLRGRLSSCWRRGDPTRVVRCPIGLRAGRYNDASGQGVIRISGH